MPKSSAILWQLWIGTFVGLALWTVVSYVTTPNPELRQEILFRHSLLMILVSLPLGGIAALIVAAAVYALGAALTPMQDAWITSISCVIASYVQWFRLVPWLRGRFMRRA